MPEVEKLTPSPEAAALIAEYKRAANDIQQQVYAGSIAMSQITAGTISASVSLTVPTLVITSGTIVGLAGR